MVIFLDSHPRSSEEDDVRPSRPIHHPKHPKHPKDSREEPSKRPPKAPKESWEEPSTRPVRPPKHPRPSVEDEDEVPSGEDECVKAYTHTFQDEEGRTCFATQPVYRCHPDCRPIRPKHKPVPHHCMPASKYEKILKEQAKHGLVSAVQNKQVDKTRHVEIPEKCL